MTVMIGPMQPTTMDQKMAGFSREAHRMYVIGVEKNCTGAMIGVWFQATEPRCVELRYTGWSSWSLRFGRGG